MSSWLRRLIFGREKVAEAEAVDAEYRAARAAAEESIRSPESIRDELATIVADAAEKAASLSSIAPPPREHETATATAAIDDK